jgi:hypothetical protein
MFHTLSRLLIWEVSVDCLTLRLTVESRDGSTRSWRLDLTVYDQDMALIPPVVG